MQIGITIEEPTGSMTLDERIGLVREAAARGFAGAWTGEPSNPDPLTTLAIIGREVPRIGLGTAIVHTYPRHPLVLAGQALTVQAATGNRLSLGISPGSRFVEQRFGYPFDKPARHLREYLTALVPLLRGEAVAYRGETLAVDGAAAVPGAAAPSLLVSALGPRTLQVAGELADGTVTAFTGPRALAEHVVPTISRAAAAAGRPAPRIAATATVSVTAEPAAARTRITTEAGFVGQLPSYRAMLEREGVAGVGDVAIVGNEATVERELRRYADAGATELIARPVGSADERARTIELLTGLIRAGAGRS